MIIRKSASELEVMKEAGRISAKALRLVGEAIAPGVTTFELDEYAEEIIRKEGAIPAFLGYGGFPATICASVNEQVVHGIPSKKVRLAEGDILSVDVGAIYDGYYGDNAYTFPVGQIKPEIRRLLEVTLESLDAGIGAAVAGNTIGDVGAAVAAVAEAAGYGIVREYTGHGIGTAMHESPEIPNYGTPGSGARLMPGMVLAIEPMINLGKDDVYGLSDGWTVVTRDGLPSAHFENTVAITAEGPALILTAE